MRTQTLEQMLLEYSSLPGTLDATEMERRKSLLGTHNYSLIVEGGHMEFDNLNKWIAAHISENNVCDIYYGKTDYDYGFAEYFLKEKQDHEKLRLAVPNIYTTYPHADPPENISKSDGNQMHIDLDPSDKDVIVFPADES